DINRVNADGVPAVHPDLGSVWCNHRTPWMRSRGQTKCRDDFTGISVDRINPTVKIIRDIECFSIRCHGYPVRISHRKPFDNPVCLYRDFVNHLVQRVSHIRELPSGGDRKGISSKVNLFDDLIPRQTARILSDVVTILFRASLPYQAKADENGTRPKQGRPGERKPN